MKIPVTPPDYRQLLSTIASAGDKAERLFTVLQSRVGPAPGGKYYHWDKLRHLSPPNGLSSEEWWFLVATARRTLNKTLPFQDKHGQDFRYVMPDSVLELLHKIDRDASGHIKATTPVTNPHTRDTYLVRSLIQEAITSSQLEGASTTRSVAKAMLQQGRQPRDPSEQMIINNYRAMNFIRTVTSESLTSKLIMELHRILTENTLEDPSAAGRLRVPDERIYVEDPRDGTLLHEPPAATELNNRIEVLCEFANQKKSEPFFHPVIRAILLHFMLAYDHPFVDGNGRTARAIFYWSMLQQEYWLTEYISISEILAAAPAKYSRSFLYTETDDGDVTYFIAYQLEVINRAIESLHEYLMNKGAEIQKTEYLIRQSPALQEALNHRQVTLLNHALKHSNAIYRVQSHRQSHNVTYDTARTDLLKLADLGLLIKKKAGRAFVFAPPSNILDRLQKLGAK